LVKLKEYIQYGFGQLRNATSLSVFNSEQKYTLMGMNLNEFVMKVLGVEVKMKIQPFAHPHVATWEGENTLFFFFFRPNIECLIFFGPH